MSNDWGNGITRITLTDGTQRTPRRIGLSYDYMDKLNSYVKAGIFVDKDNNGFTKAEQKALGKEFEKLHTERGDKINFKRMLAGKTVDYKDEEFIRLAKAAGYILAEDLKSSEEVEAAEKTKAAEETPEAKPIQPEKKEQIAATAQDPKAAEVLTLANELSEMKKTWTKEELAHPQETLRKQKIELQSEIDKLKKPYTTEVVTKRRFLRKSTQELVQTPKTPEQIEADNKKAQEKYKELDKIAKLMAIDTLYASTRPTKYAGGNGDKFIEKIVTTEDGQKLGAARIKKYVMNETLGYEEMVWDFEYYPISLRDFNENKENSYPQYYYRVAEDAKPIEGEIKLAD